jgi:hypothetical protein
MKPFTFLLVALMMLALPLTAGAVVESKSGAEYPDAVMVKDGADMADLEVTGVGLREKTMLKVDVYTICSWVRVGVDLGDDPGKALRTIDAPKRIQMDLRRSFSRQKLIDSFQKVIEKNYDDTSAFAADMETFFGYFQRDAQDKDQIVFEYSPAEGLSTILNGKRQGAITNTAFVEALWTVWFGDKPADDGLKKALLSKVR